MMEIMFYKVFNFHGESFTQQLQYVEKKEVATVEQQEMLQHSVACSTCHK